MFFRRRVVQAEAKRPEALCPAASPRHPQYAGQGKRKLSLDLVSVAAREMPDDAGRRRRGQVYICHFFRSSRRSSFAEAVPAEAVPVTARKRNK